MQTYRIFVSSPGDAQFERQRVDRVVARLNGELAGAARLVSVRWETEFYRAHDTFQTQIPRATDCNIVVAIFKARLGTELPPDFERMPDGAPYPSGTAYEVLTAIAKRQQGSELPDVFVFRYPDPPLVRLDDEQKEDDTRRQWDRLKAFFAQWFLTTDGHFKAAFQTFTSTDDFETQLDRLLRDWLRRRLAQGGTVTWPIATRGSPYPGLQSFGPKHAAVFFGRARDTARAVESWAAAGERGAGFIIVVGASGSGKSSLARAGLVPRLTTPGVIEAVDVWRVAALRPGESADGPVAALAHALMQGAADLPNEEDGRLPALPEIADGDYRTPAGLAALLAHGDAVSVKPILAALDKVARQERRAQAIERGVRCDLVVLVDQLDELFSVSVDADERRRFAAMLEQLVATRRVWIVTTLRADLYELFLKDEILFRLKEKGIAYDLVPPALTDMAEAVRGPARAANIKWEVDQATGEPLDERLIGDIDRPDLLPIVQFVLDRLYQQRATQGDDVVLTTAAYQALGTLNGAIDTAAEAAIAPLGAAAIAALPRLLRGIVVYSAAGGAVRATPALRHVPLEVAAHDEPSGRLVRALIDARILVSAREHLGVAVVGLAHQRVIEAWGRAKELIVQSADLLRVREDIEEARRRWEAAGKRNDLLIPKGLPLSEAEHAAAALREELPAATRAFVDKASRAARLRQRLTAAAALVFLAMAVAAGLLGLAARTQTLKAQQAADEARQQREQAEDARGQADKQRQQAESARAQADAQRQQAEAARKQADTQRRLAEMHLAVADELLEGEGKTEEMRQCLASTERVALHPPPTASREFFVGRWHVDQIDQGAASTTDIDWRDDGTCRYINMFARGTQTLDLKADVCSWQFEKRSDKEFVIRFQSTRLGSNVPRQLEFRILNRTRIHNVVQNYDAFRIVCPAQELDALQKILASRQQLADSDVGNLKHQHDLSSILMILGEVLSAQGKYQAALDDFIKSLMIRKRLVLSDPLERGWQRDLALSYERVGQAQQTLRKNADALDAFKSSLALRQGLVDANPDNAFWQSQVAVSWYQIGTVSDAASAKAAFGKSLEILEALERSHKLTPAQAGWPNFVRGELAKLP